MASTLIGANRRKQRQSYLYERSNPWVYAGGSVASMLPNILGMIFRTGRFDRHRYYGDAAFLS